MGKDRREEAFQGRHHESNLVWGPVGIGASIVLTVIAAMKHDLRFLFYVAWPCFAFGIWHFCKRVPYRALSIWVSSLSSVFVAFGLWGLSKWLEPSHDIRPSVETNSTPIPAPTPPSPDPKAVPTAPVRTSLPPSLPETEPRQLTLIFKDSPLFTLQRKERITKTLEEFYRYLETLGFHLPVNLPPLGIREGKVSVSAGVRPGSPVYDYSIEIGRESVDDATYVRQLYASYWFGDLLGAQQGAPDSNVHVDRAWTAEIVSSYYAHSSTGVSPPINPKSFNGWLDALWQMRQEFTSDFVDRTIFYAVGSDEPHPAPYDPMMKEFNGYFYYRLIRGEGVVDNNLGHVARINEILRSRGLL